MSRREIAGAVLAAAALGAVCTAQSAPSAQTRRPASPPGTSATEMGGRYNDRQVYVGGKWIEIKYGRPIKRGRDLFGPEDYAEALYDGAPVWRAGANVSTRLVTGAALTIGGKTVAPGEYTLFIDMQPPGWTLIVSSWPAQMTYDTNNKAALFGAYDYTPDKDVVRVPMKRETLPHSFDQLSWEFVDVSETGGRLAVIWDRQMASVPFTMQK